MGTKDLSAGKRFEKFLYIKFNKGIEFLLNSSLPLVHNEIEKMSSTI
jgi:hypothetical protein